jgi:uncharacterized protein YraI
VNRILLITVLGFSCFAAATAFAGEGYIVGGATLRAGPDNSYPSVGVLNGGATVSIEGCVDGWSWCDVGTPDGRGWVSGTVLQEEYQGQRVFVPEYGARIGISFVTFDFGTYWDANYRNRPWYGERARYSSFRPQFRPVVIDVNVRTHDSGRDEHGRDQQGHDQHPPPNNGVEPRRPMAQATPAERDAAHPKPAERDAAHPKPADAKGPPPKAEEAKAKPEPKAESKADDKDQH